MNKYEYLGDRKAEWLDKFVEELEKNIQLINQYIEFERHTVLKANCEKESLIIRFPESTIAPTLYLDDIYEQYEVSKPSVAAILVSEQIIQNQKKIQDFDIKSKLTYEYFKQNLTYKVLNSALNEKIAETSPARKIFDGELMLVPYVNIDTDRGQALFRVNRDIQNRVKMTDDEIHKYAMANMHAEDFIIRGMSDVISEMMHANGVEDEFFEDVLADEEMLFVVTTTNNLGGASALVNPQVMDSVNDRIGEDNFFIIPSSVNEILIIPASKIDDPANLQAMCQDVNSNPDLIRKEDFLSNNIFFFNGQKQEIHICNTKQEYQELMKDEENLKQKTISRGI